MKKVILVLMFVVGLNASESACDYSYDNYLKYNELFNMAFERKDFSTMRIYSSMRIYYIETSIVECSHKSYVSKLKAIRASCLHTSDLLNGATDAE